MIIILLQRPETIDEPLPAELGINLPRVIRIYLRNKLLKLPDDRPVVTEWIPEHDTWQELAFKIELKLVRFSFGFIKGCEFSLLNLEIRGIVPSFAKA